MVSYTIEDILKSIYILFDKETAERYAKITIAEYIASKYES